MKTPVSVSCFAKTMTPMSSDMRSTGREPRRWWPPIRPSCPTNRCSRKNGGTSLWPWSQLFKNNREDPLLENGGPPDSRIILDAFIDGNDRFPGGNDDDKLSAPAHAIRNGGAFIDKMVPAKGICRVVKTPVGGIET